MTDEPRDVTGACRPERIAAITLIADDLQRSRDFYQRLLDLPVIFEDADSFVVNVGGTLVNVLIATSAAELVSPATVGSADVGPRFVLTIPVDDVDATVERLRLNDVPLLNGPITRPWGPRTASVRDPSGHIWELAS